MSVDVYPPKLLVFPAADTLYVILYSTPSFWYYQIHPALALPEGYPSNHGPFDGLESAERAARMLVAQVSWQYNGADGSEFILNDLDRENYNTWSTWRRVWEKERLSGYSREEAYSRAAGLEPINAIGCPCCYWFLPDDN